MALSPPLGLPSSRRSRSQAQLALTDRTPAQSMQPQSVGLNYPTRVARADLTSPRALPTPSPSLASPRLACPIPANGRLQGNSQLSVQLSGQPTRQPRPPNHLQLKTEEPSSIPTSFRLSTAPTIEPFTIPNSAPTVEPLQCPLQPLQWSPPPPHRGPDRAEGEALGVRAPEFPQGDTTEFVYSID